MTENETKKPSSGVQTKSDDSALDKIRDALLCRNTAMSLRFWQIAHPAFLLHTLGTSDA